jgi:hypothetical protein
MLSGRTHRSRSLRALHFGRNTAFFCGPMTLERDDPASEPYRSRGVEHLQTRENHTVPPWPRTSLLHGSSWIRFSLVEEPSHRLIVCSGVCRFAAVGCVTLGRQSPGEPPCRSLPLCDHPSAECGATCGHGSFLGTYGVHLRRAGGGQRFRWGRTDRRAAAECANLAPRVRSGIERDRGQVTSRRRAAAESRGCR